MDMALLAPPRLPKNRVEQKNAILEAVRATMSVMRVHYCFLPEDQVRGKVLNRLGIPSHTGGKIDWSKIGPHFAPVLYQHTERPEPRESDGPPRKFFKGPRRQYTEVPRFIRKQIRERDDHYYAKALVNSREAENNQMETLAVSRSTDCHRAKPGKRAPTPTPHETGRTKRKLFVVDVDEMAEKPATPPISKSVVRRADDDLRTSRNLKDVTNSCGRSLALDVLGKRSSGATALGRSRVREAASTKAKEMIRGLKMRYPPSLAGPTAKSEDNGSSEVPRFEETVDGSSSPQQGLVSGSLRPTSPRLKICKSPPVGSVPPAGPDDVVTLTAVSCKLRRGGLDVEGVANTSRDAGQKRKPLLVEKVKTARVKSLSLAKRRCDKVPASPRGFHPAVKLNSQHDDYQTLPEDSDGNSSSSVIQPTQYPPSQPCGGPGHGTREKDVAGDFEPDESSGRLRIERNEELFEDRCLLVHDDTSSSCSVIEPSQRLSSPQLSVTLRPSKDTAGTELSQSDAESSNSYDFQSATTIINKSPPGAASPSPTTKQTVKLRRPPSFSFREDSKNGTHVPDGPKNLALESEDASSSPVIPLTQRGTTSWPTPNLVGRKMSPPRGGTSHSQLPGVLLTQREPRAPSIVRKKSIVEMKVTPRHNSFSPIPSPPRVHLMSTDSNDSRVGGGRKSISTWTKVGHRGTGRSQLSLPPLPQIESTTESSAPEANSRTRTPSKSPPPPPPPPPTPPRSRLPAVDVSDAVEDSDAETTAVPSRSVSMASGGTHLSIGDLILDEGTLQEQRASLRSAAEMVKLNSHHDGNPSLPEVSDDNSSSSVIPPSQYPPSQLRRTLGHGFQQHLVTSSDSAFEKSPEIHPAASVHVDTPEPSVDRSVTVHVGESCESYAQRSRGAAVLPDDSDVVYSSYEKQSRSPHRHSRTVAFEGRKRREGSEGSSSRSKTLSQKDSFRKQLFSPSPDQGPGNSHTTSNLSPVDTTLPCIPAEELGHHDGGKDDIAEVLPGDANPASIHSRPLIMSRTLTHSSIGDDSFLKKQDTSCCTTASSRRSSRANASLEPRTPSIVRKKSIVEMKVTPRHNSFSPIPSPPRVHLMSTDSNDSRVGGGRKSISITWTQVGHRGTGRSQLSVPPLPQIESTTESSAPEANSRTRTPSKSYPPMPPPTRPRSRLPAVDVSDAVEDSDAETIPVPSRSVSVASGGTHLSIGDLTLDEEELLEEEHTSHRSAAELEKVSIGRSSSTPRSRHRKRADPTTEQVSDSDSDSEETLRARTEAWRMRRERSSSRCRSRSSSVEKAKRVQEPPPMAPRARRNDAMTPKQSELESAGTGSRPSRLRTSIGIEVIGSARPRNDKTHPLTEPSYRVDKPGTGSRPSRPRTSIGTKVTESVRLPDDKGQPNIVSPDQEDIPSDISLPDFSEDGDLIDEEAVRRTPSVRSTPGPKSQLLSTGVLKKPRRQPLPQSPICDGLASDDFKANKSAFATPRRHMVNPSNRKNIAMCCSPFALPQERPARLARPGQDAQMKATPSTALLSSSQSTSQSTCRKGLDVSLTSNFSSRSRQSVGIAFSSDELNHYYRSKDCTSTRAWYMGRSKTEAAKPLRGKENYGASPANSQVAKRGDPCSDSEDSSSLKSGNMHSEERPASDAEITDLIMLYSPAEKAGEP